MKWLRACLAAAGFALVSVVIGSSIPVYWLLAGNGFPDGGTDSLEFVLTFWFMINQLILALSAGLLIALMIAAGKRHRWWIVPTTIALGEFGLLIVLLRVFEIEQDIDGPVMTPFAVSLVAAFLCLPASYVSYGLMRRVWIWIRWPSRPRLA
ncbi:MAG: hypothetical protein AAFW74_05485 [Pseudomonadota bacterium]